MRSIRQEERVEELALWWQWKTAKTRRHREAALLELCRRSTRALYAALKHLAGKLGEKYGEHITVQAWLRMHGLTDDDAQRIMALAVVEAASRFDPRRACKSRNKFSTYAYSFILGALYRVAKRRDALNHVQDRTNESASPQHTTTYKRANGWRRPIAGGAEELAHAERPDLWQLFELPQDSQGKLLGRLLPEELKQLCGWLDANAENAVDHYGYYSWIDLRATAGVLAWLSQLPPDLVLFPENQEKGAFEAVAIVVDGKKGEEKWKVHDLTLPVRAKILKRRAPELSERAMAKRLGMSPPSFRRLKKRLERQDFSKYTILDLDELARRKGRGRPKKS